MSKKRTITTIGYQIPGNSNLLLDFSSKKSLMDFDVILFAPILPYYELSSVGDGYYQGKTCYGESSSFGLKGDLEHWKNELSSALRAGKSVFFLLSEKQEFFVDTGSRSYSGTGRNRSTTVNVAPGNNYEVLPTSIGSIFSGSGKQILFTGHTTFKGFYEKFKDNLEYRLYLENIPKAEIIFTGKDASKVLGFVMKIGGGNFITLPFIDYNEDLFTEKRKDKKGEEKDYWTKEAVKFGSGLVESLLEIDSAFQNYFERTPPPAWVQKEEYLLKKEKEILDEINKNEETIKQLTNTNNQLQADAQEEVLLKNLLFEQGKQLERAVLKSLRILGFQAENYDDGELELDQVITGPENIRCIGECEGKDTKDINIDKLRQLVESMNADFYRDGVDVRASGILFGNAQRLVEPKSRTLDFTEKCKKSAEREKIALVKTVDLYHVSKYLSETNNKEYKKSCREAIYQSFGKLVKFPPTPSQ